MSSNNNNDAPYTYAGNNDAGQVPQGYQQNPYQQQQQDAFGVAPHSATSFNYPPMPAGYQQYAAVPIPAPGMPGYSAAPQYMMNYQPSPHPGPYQQQYGSNAAPYTYQQHQQPNTGYYSYNTPMSPIQPPHQGQGEAPIPMMMAAANGPANSDAPAPGTADGADAAAAAAPPSVFDCDPSAVKRVAYYNPAHIEMPDKKKGDLNQSLNQQTSGAADGIPVDPSAMSVVGYVVTLPFSDQFPLIGTAVDSAVCRHCKCCDYRGRVVKNNASSITLTGFADSGNNSTAVAHSIDGELFRPCLCNSFVHRGCFREMRSGLSVFKCKDYYECPQCKFTYKLERIMGGANKKAASKANPQQDGGMTANTNATDGFNDAEYSWLENLGEGNVRRRFIIKVIVMWLLAIIAIIAFVAVVAGASYGIDRENKNIPVFIKMMLSSASFKFATADMREQWRIDFRKPDVRVWQYYLGFSVFVSAIALMVVGIASYLCCVNTDDSEIRPSFCGFLCNSDDQKEQEISQYLSSRQGRQQQYQSHLPAPVQAAVVQREQRRSNELRDHYYRQRKASYWFSCNDNSSYYYYDSRPYYYRRRQNYYNNSYNGYGRHYYSNGYYRGNENAACCDLCLCFCVCCCDNDRNSYGYGYHHHHHHYASSSSSCDCTDCCHCSSSDCNCSSCDCGSCDCKNCKCDGGNNCDGEGAIVAALFILLVAVIVIVVSVYVTLVCYLVSRSFRLMAVAGKLAYVQSLELEDHVFALAINESWRPVGAVQVTQSS